MTRTINIREPSDYQIRPLTSAMQNGDYGLLERLSLDLFKIYSQSATVANFLGVSLAMQRKNEEALYIFNEAISIAPSNLNLYLNRGNLLLELGELEKAREDFQKSTYLNPQSAGGFSDLAAVSRDLGLVDEAINCYKRSMELAPTNLEVLSKFILLCAYTKPSEDSHSLLARRFGEIARQAVTQPLKTSFTNATFQKIRIGFVSGDFRNHSVGFFLEAILAQIDQSNFELVAYPTNSHEDDLTRRIKANFVEWRPIYGISDEEAALKIQDDEILIFF